MALQFYLYTGPETGERNETVENLKNSLKKKFGEIDEYSFYASETPVAEFMTVLQNESLFSNATCVLVKNAESIKKKDDIEIITKWASSSPAENTILILTSDEISVDSKLDKAVPASNKKVFWEMFEDRKIPWIQNFFKKNGYKIEENAASLILELIENNTETLKNECSRFFILFPKNHEITADDVDSVLSHSREENAFTLFAVMAENQYSKTESLEKSLEVLSKIRLSKENSSVLLIAGLTSCFRKLVLWHTLHSHSIPDDFALKTSGFSSKKLKTQYAKAAKVWTTGQASAILAQLAGTDMQIRSGGTLLEDVLLQKLLYEIIIKKGASLSTYETEPL